MLTRFLLMSLPGPESKIERSLMWAKLEIRGNSAGTLVDTGSVPNIVSARFYQSLPVDSFPDPQTRMSASFPAILLRFAFFVNSPSGLG